MINIQNYLSTIFTNPVYKIILSNPKNKQSTYKKYILGLKSDYYQVEKFTEKQVFHENINFDKISDYCAEQLTDNFLQLNAWSDNIEYSIMISKKGKVLFKKINSNSPPLQHLEHNKKKNYILQEGQIIEPLIDMGVLTKTGQVVNSMYDKYKQINRFVEIIDDAIKNTTATELNIIDFGCGKSYLTFILYYYFTEIRKIKVNMIGLDLKSDVIDKCNKSAKKYGYDSLRFELGDINGYKCNFDVDMVITLHACDIATDYALYNAIQWNAKMIFSVPCCHHEINEQIKSDEFSALLRYGIIKERVSALMTDAIRGNLLEYSGYKTQLLEFIDFQHTPKNILIRAIKTNVSEHHRKKAMDEVISLKTEFKLNPKLLSLLIESDN